MIARARPFPEREVAPGGWLADQLRADLERGFVGHLGRLAPDLVVDDDIFGRDRLTAGVRSKDLGAVSDDADWTVQFLWWNAETQGNWRDGWVRHAGWVGGEAGAEAARAWVERILATQDADGYLGIYAPDLRFPRGDEHGELWGQAVLLRALLAEHGRSGDARVLDAVRRAADRTLAAYGGRGATPFGPGGFAGVTHGLMFVDVLWELAHRLGDPRYLTAAERLYRDFATAPHLGDDATAAALLDPSRPFAGHGVHTWEHARALAMAAAIARAGLAAPDGPGLPYDDLEAAWAAKAVTALTASGAPSGDEFLHGTASADATGYEHCSVVERVHSLGLTVEATGDLALGDAIESLVLNVGMGMRDPIDGGVAYLKTDDSLSMAGVEGFRPPEPGAVPQTRYRYSPLHREAAVCCVPNAGRLLPAYARYQWLRAEAAIVAFLYGASTLRTTVGGAAVTIRQVTDFPATDVVRLIVEVADGGIAPFDLVLRRPGWSRGLDVHGVPKARVRDAAEGRAVLVGGPWSGRTEIVVELGAGAGVREAAGGERLVGWGPLLFAEPLPGRREIQKTYDVGVPGAGPFRDVLVHPAGPPPPRRALAHEPRIREIAAPSWSEAAAAPHAWQRWGLVVDTVGPGGARDEVRLVPMGATVLRRLTFEAG